MAAPANRPCLPWPLLVATDAEQEWFDEKEGEVLIFDELHMMATEILWARSGRRWGICAYVIRPCGERTPCPDTNLWDLALWPGMWPSSMCGCPGRCGHGPSYLRLPRPVATVDAVHLDGVLLDPSEYEVVAWKWLHRLSGEAWPATQDLSLPITEPDTFQVSFTRGREPTSAARRWVTVLLKEYLLAATGDSACRLAGNVTETIRKGVTTRSDPGSILAKYNRVGLVDVDGWLTTVNPNGLKSRSRVFRADACAGA